MNFSGFKRSVLRTCVANFEPWNQSLILDLARSRRENEFEVELKTAIMTLINALLKFGPGQEVVEFRLHLRYEFLMLGIIPLIEKLEEYENEELNLHLEVFKLQRERDEQVLRDNIKDKVRVTSGVSLKRKHSIRSEIKI